MRIIDLQSGGSGELSSLTSLRNKWCNRNCVVSEFLNFLVDYQGKNNYNLYSLLVASTLELV